MSAIDDVWTELYPMCPRGCGRTIDDCNEAEDEGECEGGELLRENQRLEADLDKTIDERDHREKAADVLAQAIARLTGVDIGEHSSENDPWRNALDAAGPALGYADMAANLAQALAEAERMRLVLAIHGQGVDPEGHYVGTPGFRLRRLMAVVDAAKAVDACWRGKDARTPITKPLWQLAAAVDALQSDPVPHNAGEGERG